MRGAKLWSSPAAPPQLRLTSTVDDASGARRNTSVELLVSEADVRLVASEAKAICAPSKERDGLKLSPLPWTEGLPSLSDTSWVVLPDPRPRRKTSVLLLVSVATRLVASDENPICVPSKLTL